MRRRIAIASSSVFNPGAYLLPVAVTEVGVARAAGDDQVVVVESRRRSNSTRRAATSMRRASPSNTRTLRARRRIHLIGAAMSPGDKRRRGDLIEQWLEDVMVLAIDERDLHVCVPQRLAAESPPKPPPMMTMRTMQESGGRKREAAFGQVAASPCLHPDPCVLIPTGLHYHHEDRSPARTGTRRRNRVSARLSRRVLLDVTVQDSKITEIDGSPLNTITNGYICAKVRRFPERLYGDDRLLYPAVRKGPKRIRAFRARLVG